MRRYRADRSWAHACTQVCRVLSVFLSICLSVVLSGCLSACMRVLRMCECTDEWAPTHLLSSGSRGILVNIRFPDDTEKVLPLQTQIFFSHMLATSRSRSLTFSHPFSLLRSHSCTLSRIYVFVCVIFLYGVADRRGRRRQHSIGNPGKGGPLW